MHGHKKKKVDWSRNGKTRKSGGNSIEWDGSFDARKSRKDRSHQNGEYNHECDDYDDCEEFDEDDLK